MNLRPRPTQWTPLGVAARIALAAVGLLLAAGLSNLALRLFWCGSASTYEYQSGPFRSINKYWGTWHFPNNEVEHRRSCFDARYRMNELGMKGPPVRPGGTRIALLGDSFVEGYGNGNDATAAHVMEGLLGPEYQVLNFGVSGHFSTVDELALYDNFAKFFDPKIVLLFFVSYNDLEDLLEVRVDKFVDGELRFIYPRVRTFDEIASYLSAQRPPRDRVRAKKRESCWREFLRIANSMLRQRAEMFLNLRWDPQLELARPYLEQEDADTRRAWAIVEASLRRLAELTRAEGTTLVVVDIADPYQLDTNWLRLASLKHRTALSASRPNRRLGAICEKLGIRFFDMLPQAEQHVREKGLSFPYLSFACDRHYDREGQRLMAELVVRYLRETGLLEPNA
jgi:hypothetical protein